MVPVAFLTHSPLGSLPAELGNHYNIPGDHKRDEKTKPNKVMLVRQTVNYKKLFRVVRDGDSDPTSEQVPATTAAGLETLRDDIGVFHVRFW